MIRLIPTMMKIHHASSIHPIKNKLCIDENDLSKNCVHYDVDFDI
jgi:hypothetical protein